MHLSMHGGTGSLQVRDLAIPYTESPAASDFNSGAKFTELLSWFQEFSGLVRFVRDSRSRTNAKWPEFTRKTQ